MADRCMHLTNYAVNKRSDKYERDTEDNQPGLGSKRSISWLLSWLSEERGEDKAAELWGKVGDICVMTVMR
jgi:tubulin polyglutamylase TTLL6/13